MSFNLKKNPKGTVAEIRDQIRKALVEQALSSGKIKSVNIDLLKEGAVGTKIDGALKGAVYELVAIGDPIGLSVVKVIKYPSAPSAVGNNFRLQNTIDRWGMTHPLVAGVVNAIAKAGGLNPEEEEESSWRQSAEEAELLADEEIDIEDYDEVPPPSIPAGVMVGGTVTGGEYSPDADDEFVEDLFPEETPTDRIDLDRIAATADADGSPSPGTGPAPAPPAPVSLPSRDQIPAQLRGQNPRTVSWTSTGYRDLRGMSIEIPEGSFDALKGIVDGASGSSTVGTWNSADHPAAVYGIKLILDAIPDMAGIRAPSDPENLEFDQQTKRSVEEFQRYVQISVDGKVGPNTTKALLGLPGVFEMRERQEALVGVFDALSEYPSTPIRVEPAYVARTELSTMLQTAGIANPNILAGILGNVAAESGRSQNYKAVGDDLASKRSMAGITSDIDPETLRTSQKNSIKASIPTVAPQRPPSLYRSFGLIQWNVDGGEGARWLESAGLSQNSPSDKIDELLSLSNQVAQIKILADRTYGPTEVSRAAVANDDLATAAAYEWATEVEKFRDYQNPNNPSHQRRQRNAREILNDPDLGLV
jgi:peptidoglycan hydrolase-like protein with peptidoglycan-binding domain